MFKNISSKVLSDLLGAVVGIVENKQVMPILGNVLIECADSRVTMITSDGDIQIIASSDVVVGLSDGSTTIGAKKLQSVLKACGSVDKVSIDIKDATATVKAGKSKFKLQTMPSNDFPKSDYNFASSWGFEIEQETLKSLIYSVSDSMAVADVRYYLNGLHLSVNNGVMLLAATNGHCVSVNSVNVECEGNHEAIIPRKVVLEMLKMLSGSELVNMHFSDTKLSVGAGNIHLIGKLVEGKFPDVERVIDSANSHATEELAVKRDDILGCLNRASIMSNDKFRAVTISLANGNCRLVATNSSSEEAVIGLDAEYDGCPVEQAFNVDYLKNGINTCGDDEVIMKFSQNANNSMKIESPNHPNFSFVCMPMRV